MKNTKPNIKKTPGGGERCGYETYLAPPPPSKGKVIGIDCHPDTFTAAVFRGTTPHNARKLSCKADMSLGTLLKWAAENFTRKDLLLMEAGANSFEIHHRLLDLGLRAVVMESCHVGKHAKTYADNDKMAAARIALVFLQGGAPCVWVPDAKTRERRELLHAHQSVVRACTASTNALKGFLNQYTIRPGKRGLHLERTEEWALKQREWTPLQEQLLGDHFHNVRVQAVRRKELERLIAHEICTEPMMLRCLSVLGIGKINAFALLAIIGDVRRFETAAKLAAYLGLNPGQRESGRGKRVKLGVGKHGRADMRALLIQAAQTVMRNGRDTPLGKWAWKLFARKGQRNVAVAAVARKLVVQVWHLLSGNTPIALEPDKRLASKLQRLVVSPGKGLRQNLGLPSKSRECVLYLHQILLPKKEAISL